jgi:hypothetical protein
MGAFLRPVTKIIPMNALTLLLQEIQAEVPGLLLQFPESEAIHRFRVRIKQLRALERLLSQEMAWRSISDVYRAAGAIRDLEHRLRFTKKVLGTGHVLYRHLLQTRPERLQSLNGAMREFDRRAFVAAVQTLETDLSKVQDAENLVWIQCRSWLRKARFRLRKSNRKEEALHAARKALKQSLHLLQCFHAAEKLKPLRDLEQDIGSWHDEWDWCRQAAEVMGSSGKEAFPDKQADLQKVRRMLRKRVLNFRLRQLR